MRLTRSRLFAIGILALLALMIAMIAWAYTVAERRLH